MKAIVLHEFGAPGKLTYEDVDDPVAGLGTVLVRVAGASINPVDWKLRSGELKDKMPLELPAILGRDLSGIVRAVGEGVTQFAPGDHVFALAEHAYAELCAVPAEMLARVPEGLDLIAASTLPLVTLTGDQVVRLGAELAAGQTVLIAGALGGVGRTAVHVARELGATVIAGVRKRQLEDAASLRVKHTVALDDEDALAEVGLLDAVVDLVGGKTAETLMGKVKPGGVFATVLGPPSNADLHPTVRVASIFCQPDPARMVELAEAVVHHRFAVPVDRMLPLREAAEGQAAAAKGGIGKVVLLA